MSFGPQDTGWQWGLHHCVLCHGGSWTGIKILAFVSHQMITLRVKKVENEMSEWKEDRMKGSLNHCCALCDLKTVTHNVHSVPTISVLYMMERPAAGCCLTGLAPISCHGQRLIATFLPGSKALCAHTSSGSLWQRQGPYYIPRHKNPTSNTFL